MVEGRVSDGHGVPVPHVLVSDGVTVTTTDRAGRFALAPEGPFVFVTVPAEYTCAAWYVRSDVPTASFVLEKQPAAFPYRFAHISDMHLGRGVYYPYRVELGTRRTLAEFFHRVAETESELGAFIATGDLTDAGVPSEFDDLRAAVSSSPVDVRLLPGNHDHMAGRMERAISPGGYVLHSADPSAYERHLGPRWYSFDLPELHVIAVDWHTHEFGLDTDKQNAWMKADLESQPVDKPWILLSHDQPWHTMLDHLPRRPLATFSGHRHVSRVIEVDGVLHVTTPTPLFGGLDGTPPSYRVIRWDGQRLNLTTHVEPPLPKNNVLQSGTTGNDDLRSARRWMIDLPGRTHDAGFTLIADQLVTPYSDEDSQSAGITSINPSDGSTRWRTELPAAVRSAPAAAGDRVAVTCIDGSVIVLHADTGEILWNRSSREPLRTFVFASPTVHEGRLFLADSTTLRSLCLESGELLWSREIAPYQTFATTASPVMAGGTLLFGQWPATRQLIGLDPDTGDIRWGHSDETEVLRSRAPLGTPILDPKTGDLFASTVDGLARIDVASGEIRWQRAHTLPWNPHPPLLTDQGVLVTDTGYGVVLLERDTGEPIWTCQLQDESAAVKAAYQRTGHTVYASPCELPGALAVPGLDSKLHLIRSHDGSRIRSLAIDAPIAARPIADRRAVYIRDVAGRLTAFDYDALLRGVL